MAPGEFGFVVEQVAFRVPNGWFGAAYGSWPFVAVLGIPLVQGIVEQAVGVVVASAGIMAVSVATRTGLWARHRRRNYVVIAVGELRIAADGHVTIVPFENLESVTWWHGVWSATFDRMGNYSAIEIEDVLGNTHATELLLPRLRDQRNGLTELGRRLPLTSVTVHWPYSRRKPVAWKPSTGLPAPR